MLENRKSKRKPTGGLRNSLRRRDKRLSGLANHPINTTIGDEKKKIVRGRGANLKVKAVATKVVSVAIDGKNVKAEILKVIENTANKDFVRRNVITKGAKLKIKYKDKEYTAKVTSRPGQIGVVSAVIV